MDNVNNTIKVIKEITCMMFNQNGNVVAQYPGYTDGNNTACIMPNHPVANQQNNSGFMGSVWQVFYHMFLMMIVGSLIQMVIRGGLNISGILINRVTSNNTQINPQIVRYANFATLQFINEYRNKIDCVFKVDSENIKKVKARCEKNASIINEPDASVVLNSIQRGLSEGLQAINEQVKVEFDDLAQFNQNFVLMSKIAFLQLMIDAWVIKADVAQDLQNKFNENITQNKLDIPIINSIRKGMMDALVFCGVLKMNKRDANEENGQNNTNNPNPNIKHNNANDGTAKKID